MNVSRITKLEETKTISLDEHDLAIAIHEFLKARSELVSTDEVTVDSLDWDISQGSLLRGVTVTLVRTATTNE